MKQFIILVCLIFFAENGKAQKAVVANLKKDVVDVGYPNPLEIAVEGYQCSEFKVKTNNGFITKEKADCSYNYVPDKEGLSQVIISTKEGKVISIIKFRAKFIQIQLIAALCGPSSGILYIEDLDRCNEIYAETKNFDDWDSGFRIQKYCVSVITNGDSVFTNKDILGQAFSEDLKQRLKRTEQGSKLVFYGITALGPDKRVLEVSPMEFTISKKTK